MKLSYLVLLGFGIALSSGALAETKTEVYDYKCYLDTSIGSRIAFYEWPSSSVQTRMANLTAKRVHLPSETIRPFIKEVIECVKMDESFSLAVANKLDEKTAK